MDFRFWILDLLTRFISASLIEVVSTGEPTLLAASQFNDKTI
jgi:hypothetical protein